MSTADIGRAARLLHRYHYQEYDWIQKRLPFRMRSGGRISSQMYWTEVTRSCTTLQPTDLDAIMQYWQSPRPLRPKMWTDGQKEFRQRLCRGLRTLLLEQCDVLQVLHMAHEALSPVEPGGGAANTLARLTRLRCLCGVYHMAEEQDEKTHQSDHDDHHHHEDHGQDGTKHASTDSESDDDDDDEHDHARAHGLGLGRRRQRVRIEYDTTHVAGLMNSLCTILIETLTMDAGQRRRDSQGAVGLGTSPIPHGFTERGLTIVLLTDIIRWILLWLPVQVDKSAVIPRDLGLKTMRTMVEAARLLRRSQKSVELVELFCITRLFVTMSRVHYLREDSFVIGRSLMLGLAQAFSAGFSGGSSAALHHHLCDEQLGGGDVVSGGSASDFFASKPRGQAARASANKGSAAIGGGGGTAAAAGGSMVPSLAAMSDPNAAITSKATSHQGFLSEMMYVVFFYYWLHSFDEQRVALLIRDGVDSIAAGALLALPTMERLVNVIVMCISNIAHESQEAQRHLAVTGFRRALHAVQETAWEDPQVAKRVADLEGQLRDIVESSGMFDVFSMGVTNESLYWAPYHRSERFWRDSVRQLCRKDYAVMRGVVGIVEKACALATAAPLGSHGGIGIGTGSDDMHDHESSAVDGSHGDLGHVVPPKAKPTSGAGATGRSEADGGGGGGGDTVHDGNDNDGDDDDDDVTTRGNGLTPEFLECVCVAVFDIRQFMLILPQHAGVLRMWNTKAVLMRALDVVSDARVRREILSCLHAAFSNYHSSAPS